MQAVCLHLFFSAKLNPAEALTELLLSFHVLAVTAPPQDVNETNSTKGIE